MRRLIHGPLWALGIFLVLRALAEPFTIDDDYASDWGGPTKAGVLAVHMLPGLIAAAIMVTILVRRRQRKRRAEDPAPLERGTGPS